MKIQHIALLLVLTSCSLFQSNLRDRSSYFDYFTKDKVEGKTSSKILEDLTVKTNMAGGDYRLRIFPLVSPFVHEYSKELASTRGLNPNAQESLREKMLNKYIVGKTCVDLEYDVMLRKQVSHVTSWKMWVVDYKEESFLLEWLPVETEPVKSFIPRGVETLESWSHRGVGCTNTKIPLERGFKVKVQAAYVRFPFSTTMQEEWIVPLKEEQKQEFGEEGYRKKKVKGYRGW